MREGNKHPKKQQSEDLSRENVNSHKNEPLWNNFF